MPCTDHLGIGTESSTPHKKYLKPADHAFTDLTRPIAGFHHSKSTHASRSTSPGQVAIVSRQVPARLTVSTGNARRGGRILALVSLVLCIAGIAAEIACILAYAMNVQTLSS